MIMEGPRQHSNYKFFMMTHSVMWEKLVIAVIVAHVHLVLICLTYYKNIIMQSIQICYYIFELIYFVDLIFHILHRNFSSHKSDLCIKKVPFLILLLGFISVIPYHETYEYLLFRETSPMVSHYFKLKVLVRLSHVIFYFVTKSHESGINRIALLFFQSVITNLLFVCFVSCVLEFISCRGCIYDNWTMHLKDVQYHEDKFVDRFFFPVTFIAGVLFGNYPGVLITETIAEHCCLLVTQIFGFIVKVNLILAQLTCEYINKKWRKSSYSTKRVKIIEYLSSQNVSKELLRDIDEYYNVLWTKRTAIIRVPRCFKILPLGLQKEINLDLNWDAINHSHLFRNRSMHFKRHLCMIIKSEFLLKGDSIYDSGDLKNKFIYIVSGLVQLLSEEDDESPVVSFSSGTVISELSCLMITRSESKLRCATYCEFKVLELEQFYRNMYTYKSHVRDFQKVLRDRIRLAKHLQKCKQRDTSTETQTMRPLRRVKLHWYSMLTDNPIVSPCNTSKYLDLLALSDEIELKVEVVCLTSSFPLILDPDSSFRQFLDMFFMAASGMQAFLIPYYAAFHRQISHDMRTFFMFLDIIYIVDIYVQITTAIKENDLVIIKFSGILLHRIRQLSFLIDVVALVPLDYIVWCQGTSDQNFILSKQFRILKIYKLMQLVHMFEKKLSVNMFYVMILKYYLLSIIAIYFSMCVLYFASCFNESCVGYTWYPRNFELMNTSSSIVNPALHTLVLVTNILASGTGNVYFFNALDACLFTLVVVIGYYLVLFCLAQITAVGYWDLHEETSNKIFIKSMMNYARIHKIPFDIVMRISNMLKFRWEHTHDLVKVNAREFFDDLPKNINERLNEELAIKYLQNLPFFDMLQDETKKQLGKMCMIISFPRNSYLTLNDQIIDYIYIVKCGYAKSHSIVPGDEEQKTDTFLFTAGQCFPVIEVLHVIPCFVTVRAMTAVDTIAIPYAKFLECVKMDPAFYRLMQNALKAHMNQHRVTLQRSLRRMNFELEKHATKGRNFFTYEVFDPKDVDTAGERSFWLRTFNAHNKWYIVYESTHCALVVFLFVTLMLELNVLHSYTEPIRYVHLTLDIISWLDIYIRTHVRYYNEYGIVVKKYRSTVRHYLSTSFAVDMYSSCPITTLSIESMICATCPVRARYLILLVTRPLQLHRVFYGIWYLCNRVNMTQVNMIRIQCMLFVVVFVFMYTNLMILFTCDVDSDQLKCPGVAWIGSRIAETTHANSLILYAYFAGQYLTASPKNIYATISNSNYVFYVCLTFISLGIYWILTSKLTSLGLHGEYMTSQLQNDRMNFKIFAKKEMLDVKIQARVVMTNEYLTRDTESYALVEAELRFTPQLFADVSYSLSSAAVRETQLFHDTPEYFIRMFSPKLRRDFYMKDSIILRPNNINKYVYIIKHGNVDIFMAGYKMASLGPGGIFGSLVKYGYMRQTIEAIATMHTEVLYMESTQFYKTSCKDEYVRKHLDLLIKHNPEFVPKYVDVGQLDPAAVLAAESVARQTEKNYRKWFRAINRIFNQNKKAYLIFVYIIDVHLSMISSLFVMIYQFLALYQPPKLAYVILLYTFDGIFCIKIFWGFCLTYVDEVSGLVVDNQKKIILRYLKSGFIIDILSVAMPELYFGSLITNQFYKTLLISNRLLRFIYLFRHYSNHRKHNKLTHHLRWTFLLYTTFFYVQFFNNVWNIVSCSSRLCHYRKFVSHEQETYVPASTYIMSYLLSYINVINYFTGTSLRMMKPLTIGEIIVTLVIVISAVFIMTMIYSGYTFIQLIDNYNLGQYNHQLEEIRTYLQQQRLSPAILEKVMYYYYFIWKVQKGEQWPRLIKYTDQFIKEDINADIYYEHLHNHVILKTTHTDFLRQLCVYLRRSVYPTSYTITNRGDMDDRLYFIHRGEVGYFEETGNELREAGVLLPNSSFGELAGFKSGPHKYTYIAKTFVIILTLSKQDWKYLLDFFPATVENIAQQLRAHYET